jgi:hypothetical protein
MRDLNCAHNRNNQNLHQLATSLCKPDAHAKRSDCRALCVVTREAQEGIV